MRALRQSGKHWHRGLTGAPHPTHRARPQWRSMQSFMRTLTGYAQRAQISPGRCANCWCTSAALTVSTLATRCVQAGTPAGDFHPMSSRPCGADQKKPTRVSGWAWKPFVKRTSLGPVADRCPVLDISVLRRAVRTLHRGLRNRPRVAAMKSTLGAGPGSDHPQFEGRG